MLTPSFGEEADIERYDAFMHELVELIVDKYDGSLKAEHGTGINMAPFVEREWGSEATELMWRVKQLADPDGILAPGIVLNRDRGVHLRNLKIVPEIEEIGHQVHRVRLLRAGVPVAKRDHDAPSADRPAARDGPPAGGFAGRCERSASSTSTTRSRPAPSTARATHACPVAIDTGDAGQGAAPRASTAPARRTRRGGRGQRYATAERSTRAALGAAGAPRG